MAGRPKGTLNDRLWRDAIRKAALERVTKNGPQKIELAARAIVEAAAGGDTAAAKELGNRLDGLPHQTTEISADGPLVVQIVKYADN
jgi:hypothetical protein